jgi:hypothetical protein
MMSIIREILMIIFTILMISIAFQYEKDPPRPVNTSMCGVVEACSFMGGKVTLLEGKTICEYSFKEEKK